MDEAYQSFADMRPDQRLAFWRDFFSPVFEADLLSPVHPAFFSGGTTTSMSVDFREASDHYVIAADMPGLGEEDVQLEIGNHTLTITGEKETETKLEGQAGEAGASTKTARRYKRVLQLPQDVDEASVEAHMEKGVLQLTLPKRDASAAAKRRIPIQGAQPKAAIEA